MNYVKRILEAHFLTLTELAAYMEIDRSHLGHLLSAKNPKKTNKTIRRIALALSVIDKQPWQLHAQNLKDEFYPQPVKLRVIGGNDE